MATSYLDEYQALDAQPYQKAKLYQYLNDNIDQLQMTPEESYKFNWGADALSSDWISKKAGEIQKNVEESNSANILRRGLGKPKEEAADDEKDDDSETTDTSTEQAKLLEIDGGNGDGPSFSGVSGDTGIGIGDMSTARDQAAAGAFLKGSIPAALTASPVGMARATYNAANISNETDRAVLGAVNASTDPIAQLNAIQGWTNIDQDYMGGVNTPGDGEAGYGNGGGIGGRSDPHGSGTGDGSDGGRDSNSMGSERGHG